METEGPRILLVYDEKSIQDILIVTLQSAVYSPYGVSTGEEALRNFSWPDLG
jgi:CheY-like chemotaxis protein